ncbi:dienelactone hydrolase family protein [Phytomonospora sp. NPDC050363]|uniref:dienelactone hydrolase family protein n=1 Tax=Phytomonospora sp. NPDC050363 TaxID=3155642 RepID=UPI00340914FE
MRHRTEWGVRRRTSKPSEQRSFVIHRAGPRVPGTVWTPVARPGPVPLVLLGHGGSGHRHSDRVSSMAERFAQAGFAAAAIDGPYHGDRVPSSLTPAEYQARIVAEGIGRVLDRVAEEWVATRDLLVDAGIADRTRQAYFGLSMGTRLGLAAAAALAPDLKCAVFGKFGTRSAAGLDPGLRAPVRALDDASGIAAPVLFHLQWDDELFPRTGQLELFDAFPNPAKELHAFAGRHGRTPEHAPDLWHAFIERHLA